MRRFFLDCWNRRPAEPLIWIVASHRGDINSIRATSPGLWTCSNQIRLDNHYNATTTGQWASSACSTRRLLGLHTVSYRGQPATADRRYSGSRGYRFRIDAAHNVSTIALRPRRRSSTARGTCTCAGGPNLPGGAAPGCLAPAALVVAITRQAVLLLDGRAASYSFATGTAKSPLWSLR